MLIINEIDNGECGRHFSMVLLTHLELLTLRSPRIIRGSLLLCNSKHLCHFKMLSPAGYPKDSNFFVSYDYYANRSLTFFCQEDDDVSERFEAATLLWSTLFML